LNAVKVFDVVDDSVSYIGLPSQVDSVGDFHTFSDFVIFASQIVFSEEGSTLFVIVRAFLWVVWFFLNIIDFLDMFIFMYLCI